jgi:peptidoglycan/LPS O-acetylase OafA/YrhL
MALCIPFAFAWMLPVAFKDFSQSLGAIALFSSNVLFWLEADYFAEDAEEKPLLHTWSLAVEEQYYVLFPLFLLLLWRAGRRNAVLATTLLALVSLFLSELGWRLAPVANFYLLPTRAWELLAGSLCAFWMRERPPSANGPLALLGLGMILYSVLVFNAETPFPSLHTLLPVGGAALVILYGEAGTLAARVLSARPMVGVGLVSYSAYLWHQPLFAFARIRSPLPPEPWVLALLAAASFPLAYLTWRYVERPFRARTPRAPGPARDLRRRRPWASSPSSGSGSPGRWAAGFRRGSPPEVLQAIDVRRGDTSGCLNRFSNAELLEGRNCRIGRGRRAATIALLGDSHAAAITDAFGEALESWSLSALTFSGSWCAPLDGVRDRQRLQEPGLPRRMNAAFRQVMANEEVENRHPLRAMAELRSGPPLERPARRRLQLRRRPLLRSRRQRRHVRASAPAHQ